jgi:hypothetical protein
MYTDHTLLPIYDNSPYIAEGGTQYPGNYPKDQIEGLFKVTETAQPTDPTLVVMGFTIDSTHTQVWTTRAQTESEVAATAAQNVIKQASAALAAGMALTSTGTPALNGTYSLTPQSVSNVNATVTYILLNGAFFGGSSVMPWADMSGAMHTFPSIAEFKSFATAFASLIAQIQLYADSGGAVGSIPSNQVTIA